MATITELRQQAADCRACPLWENATQTVFSAGPETAKVMLVGESPGDVEDRRGEPFVGPAGQLLRQALAELSLEPEQLYLTNAVKHFKWEPRGRRRIHKTPTMREVNACSQWLEGEIDALKPRVIACLGATAAKAVISKDFKITAQRGRFIEHPQAPFVFATVHPSYLLRLPDQQAKDAGYRDFLEDLGLIQQALAADG